ncbi:MAG TPA: LysR family transcriptional regulator [Aestuariivirgaceae bacterium]|jgi:molybdate transport system regulatory protein|nr:LysR family transcriptional regulator [Aestuariivirgaceae bacterium]
MAKLSIRIDLEHNARLGPGKVLVLERIAEHGSIAAAGRSLSMSYRRVWELVSETNAAFREPLVTSRLGGQNGGGATLTPLGKAIVQEYRLMERKAQKAVARQLRLFDNASRQ